MVRQGSKASRPEVSEKVEKSSARPGRPRKVDSEHLLKIAREVFLERGIRASTQEVAERAGVSEGTLFHRFKNKERLFRQAMQLSEDDIPELLEQALSSISGLELEEALHRFAQALLEIGRVGVPLMMMSWSNPCSSMPTEANALRFRSFIKHLAGYFELQMDAGKLRRMDAEVVARTFLGAVHHYCMTRVMTPNPAWVLPEGMYVRGLVDLVLHGIVAPQSEASSPRAASLPTRRSR